MNHDGMATDSGILAPIRDGSASMSCDLDPIETGMIDSLALVTMITALEERFACQLPLDDFDIENLSSARRISRYVHTSGVLDTRSAS